MAWDEESARDGTFGGAGEYASALKTRLRDLLVQAGHGECASLQQATYDPASGSVVCGCGVFEPFPQDDPDAPPWSPHDPDYADAEAADRAANRALQKVGGNTIAEPADPIRSTLALIDPSEVYGPEDVERHILDVLFRLETGALFERETITKAYETAMAHDLKFNATVDTSDRGAADQRKAHAFTECAEEYKAMMEAKMLKEAVKQTMHNLRAVLSGYQSTAKSVSASYQAGGSQGAPPQQNRRPW